MKEFFQENPAWLIFVGLATVAGLVGFVIQMFQTRSAKKELQRYKYLFKLADQNIEHKDKTDELKRLNTQVSEMQKTLKDEIPKEASRIALERILQSELDSLSDNYSKVRVLRDQLGQSSEDISNNILNHLYC